MSRLGPGESITPAASEHRGPLLASWYPALVIKEGDSGTECESPAEKGVGLVGLH